MFWMCKMAEPVSHNRSSNLRDSKGIIYDLDRRSFLNTAMKRQQFTSHLLYSLASSPTIAGRRQILGIIPVVGQPMFYDLHCPKNLAAQHLEAQRKREGSRNGGENVIQMHEWLCLLHWRFLKRESLKTFRLAEVWGLIQAGADFSIRQAKNLGKDFNVR